MAGSESVIFQRNGHSRVLLQSFLNHTSLNVFMRASLKNTIKVKSSVTIHETGGRVIRVRGHAKVMCHLMFGILALTRNQIMCFLE